MTWILIDSLGKFHMGTADVKVNLFRSFRTPLYPAQICWNYRLPSIRQQKVAYNDIMMRLLLRLRRYPSAGQLFANTDVPAFQTVIRNPIFKFITGLDKSETTGTFENRRVISDLLLP